MRPNTFLYEIARWSAAVAAVISLIWMFGGNTVSNADPVEVAEAVVETIDMENMLEADNQLIKRFYGLDPANFEGCILYYPTTNMMAEEILIVKLKDMSQQEQVRTAIEKRIETQKTTFEGYGVEPFIARCKESVWNYKGMWEEMSDRVGFWCDMEDPYVTYEDNYIESEWWALKQIYEKGLLYKGFKIVPYCPRCGTPLSTHEVAQG